MSTFVAAGDAHAAGATAAAGPAPTGSPDGVRLARLRGGSGGTLFLMPGLEGLLDELTPLVAAFTGPQEVYGVAPLPEDAQRRPVADLERMGELVLEAIRGVQPAGPYLLGGYSFGALVALEVAQQLRCGGEVVEALFLIDAVYDERYWPRGLWLRGLLRRSGWALSRIVRMSPSQAAGELRRRGWRLVLRVIRRKTAAPDPLTMSAEATAPARARAALSGYCPRRYDGQVTLVIPAVDRHFGCDTARLWTGYATRVEVWRVDGDHLSVIREPAAVAAVARLIDHRLASRRPDWPGLRPAPGFERPMIVTTMRWFSAARLAHALTEAGFAVSACRPTGHPLALVDGLTGDHRLRRMSQLPSLATAIRTAKPDVILPDDERALVLLRRLYARTRSAYPQTAAIIARSLGDTGSWPLITSRAALVSQARRMGIPAPATEVVGDAAALGRWAVGEDFPIVLKTDGSWGGRGIAIVRGAASLRGGWRAMSNPPRLPHAAKRLLVNREAGPLTAWVTRRHPVVNAQQFVDGREAMVTAACVHGEVTALVCLEVVAVSEPRGPSSVVRVIDHPGMADAARRLAARLGLHGFCGFDFIITVTGEARLIELNPRITPTAHLLAEGGYPCGQTIVLFPPGPAVAVESEAPDRSADPGAPGSAETGTLDLPVRAPSLIRCGERIAVRRNRPVARLARRVQHELSVRLAGRHAR